VELASVSGICTGRDLEMAVHGSRQQIRAYLNEVRALAGRQEELHSADVISAEKGHRRLACLDGEHRVINPGNPGGPGRLDD
jgi:hypothetical protein